MFRLSFRASKEYQYQDYSKHIWTQSMLFWHIFVHVFSLFHLPLIYYFKCWQLNFVCSCYLLLTYMQIKYRECTYFTQTLISPIPCIYIITHYISALFSTPFCYLFIFCSFAIVQTQLFICLLHSCFLLILYRNK